MKNLNIQEYVSFGYLYLLLLGVISETVFYNLIGLNILNYATISDILLSPVSIMSANPILLVFTALILGLSYLLAHRVIPRMTKPGSGHKPAVSPERLLSFLAILFFMFFIGVEVGSGIALRKLIDTGKTVPNYVITFTDNQKKEVKIVGQNAAYIFYVARNEKDVVIAPIGNSISLMVKIKK